MIQENCRMYRNSNLKQGCKSLCELVCASGKCSFYKPNLVKMFGEIGIKLFDGQQKLIKETDIMQIITTYVPIEKLAFYETLLKDNYKYYMLEEELNKKHCKKDM